MGCSFERFEPLMSRRWLQAVGALRLNMLCWYQAIGLCLDVVQQQAYSQRCNVNLRSSALLALSTGALTCHRPLQ